MKKKLQIIIDILMFILFLILMGYHITGNKVHEILGVITFILFIIHHIINIRWYKALPKGKYTNKRVISTIVDFLLLIDMLCIMISAIMISSTVFEFLNLKTTMFARGLHLSSTAWGLFLISIHLGLHLQIHFDKLKNKLKSSSFEYTFYLLLFLILIYGIYALIKNALWKDMFLITTFKFFDYNQNPIIFYLEYLGIIFLVILITYGIEKVLKNRKRRRK